MSQIHVDNLFVIEHDLNATAFAGKNAAVPLAGFIDCVLCRFEAIINRSSGAFLVDPIPAV